MEAQRQYRAALGKEACAKRSREYSYRVGRTHPAKENPKCSNWLGIWIAERVLSRYFNELKRMPPNNPGYDFLCSKGFKIDVKSGCRQSYDNRRIDRWTFVIDHNKIADYFMCLAFDNRTNLNPEHVWLIPKELVSEKHAVIIYDNRNGLSKWSAYEKPIDRVLDCCKSLKI
ncbi:MAG: hypothetical protein PHE11_08115 [Candidatus Omnitrophica bacterium]|nr:hypothetical protein [Candidatus Omnitrophota bacterium]